MSPIAVVTVLPPYVPSFSISVQTSGSHCHVRKSIPVLEELYKKLGLSRTKKTTDDMMFTVETVSCLGACGLAPTMMVNEDVHPRMTPEKADELIDKLRGGEQG